MATRCRKLSSSSTSPATTDSQSGCDIRFSVQSIDWPGQWTTAATDRASLQHCWLHHVVLGPVGDRQAAPKKACTQEGASRSCSVEETSSAQRRRYGISTVETIDSVFQTRHSRQAHLFKEECAQGGAWEGMRSRRRARKRACGGGARPSILPSHTRTEEGVYASRLYPTYPDKPSSTVATRTCQLNGKHAIASRVRLRLLHQSSAVIVGKFCKRGGGGVGGGGGPPEFQGGTLHLEVWG